MSEHRDGPLPPAVLRALADEDVIGAIKLLREATGLGLKESKDLLDAHLRGELQRPTPAGAARPPAGGLPPAALDALRRGHKIEAIRLVREHAGSGLKEAKDAVEAAERTLGLHDPMRSPGEVPRRGAWIAPLLLCIAGAAGLYWAFVLR